MKKRTSPTAVGPVYDDFEPSTEFFENNETRFLRIHLPGFTGQQMKITYKQFNRALDISGERQIDGEYDKWVRLNQSYPIPQNCEEGKLQANFAHGVLTITMPKKIVSQNSPKTEARQKGPFPSTKQEPRHNGKAQEDNPQKAREITQNYSAPQVVEPRPKKGHERIEGPKHEKAHERIPQESRPSKLEEQKPEGVAGEEIPYRFRIRRGKEDLIQQLEDPGRGLKALGSQQPTKESRPEKGLHKEPELKSTIIKPQGKPIVKTEQRPTLKIAPNKPKDEKPQKAAEEIERGSEGKKGESEGKLAGEPEKMFQEKKIRTRKNTAEKEKETLYTKEDIVNTIEKGMRQVSASTSEVVTKISKGKWKEEEKPMLVNMGAAILVIAALGVYVSYKLTSSGST